MSILPYGEASVIGWTGAFGLSAALHGVAVIGLLSGAGGWLVAAPEPPESAPFMISFTPLNSEPVEVIASPLDPVEETPAGITPETVTPTAPEVETLQPVAADVLAPDVVTNTVETAEPVPLLPSDTAPTGGGAVAVPPDPAPRLAPATTEQDLALAEWIEKIRAAPPQPCLAALLRREGDIGVGLTLVASDQAALSAYSDQLFTGETDLPRVSRVLVDPLQCPALEFLRDHADYPATRLGLGVEASVVTSGGRMTGFVRGAAGRQLSLLLVDDNGVVQNLNRFLSFSGNVARFDVPVTRDGEPRQTSQVLIAFATRGQPTALVTRAGQLAAEVFAGLPRDLSESALMAVATVEVR